MVKRRRELKLVLDTLKRYPVVGIVGARQVGKTTLAREIVKHAKRPYTFFDLENPEDLSRLSAPMIALKDLKGLIVIDEIQKQPDIYPVIRVLADRPKRRSRFLILGSASPAFIKKSSETLAGRVYYHELKGFSLEEVGVKKLDTLWLKGYFPRAFLSHTLKTSYEWRREFIKTYLERDIPELGIRLHSYTLYRFWNMLAHWHGQIWNSSEFGRSFGISDTTARNYLDILAGTFMVRQLKPWHENISKRQVKSPKIYLTDTGILHTLLNIKSRHELLGHPKIGASWEGFVIDQLIQHMRLESDMCFFWATHAGAELDLFVIKNNRRIGFEVKFTTSPRIDASMRSAISTLNLHILYVIHAGDKSYMLDKKIQAISVYDMLKLL